MKDLICIFTASVCLIFSLSAATTSVPARLDAEGIRQFSPLPAPGVHPRVFFTAEELPQIKARLDSSNPFGSKFAKVLRQTTDQVRREYSAFAVMDFSSPTPEQLNQYVKADEGRNIRWGMAALSAVVYDDTRMKELMIGTIVNYAKLLLASRELKIGGNIKGATGLELNKQFNFWETDSFDVTSSWLVGAAGYALSYDVLYNDMTDEQRAIVREAIALSTAGRRVYGMDLGRGFAASNHYGYHGDLAVLLAAIEGEPGYDQATFENISKVLQDYWEVGFTPSGACHEDAYGPNLGLRAGGRGLMVLARRGYNIFETSKFRNFMNYYALELEPFAGGRFMGGASGGPYGEVYPTSALIMRYMYPENATANYVYRHMVGDAYERGFKWQGRLDYMLYGGVWQGAESREAALEQADLPLTVFYPVRGKQVFRSDWSEQAMQFTLDARPDAFLIGHDRVDRGNFTMSALGRSWATAGDFRKFESSDEHSLIHIDGKAQAWKAPSVRFLSQSDDAKGSIAVADLKYAYDWQWSPPWPKVDGSKYQSWEKENASPIDLGWPESYQPDWLPEQLFGSETGYSHTNGLRKRAYNTVEQAVRATVAVRGAHPFVLICDEIQKDSDRHNYTWYMQVPVDLEIKQQQGRDLILGEVGRDPVAGERCLLIRVLSAEEDPNRTPDTIEFELETYVAHLDKRRNIETPAKRVLFTVESIAPHFRVLLYPFRFGDVLPDTKNSPAEALVQWPDQTSTIHFSPSDEKGLLITID